MLEETRKWMGQVLELLLWLVAVLVLIQILFGSDATAFFGFDVISNLGVLVAKFGNAGLVGIIAAAIVAYYIVKNRDALVRLVEVACKRHGLRSLNSLNSLPIEICDRS